MERSMPSRFVHPSLQTLEAILAPSGLLGGLAGSLGTVGSLIGNVINSTVSGQPTATAASSSASDSATTASGLREPVSSVLSGTAQNAASGLGSTSPSTAAANSGASTSSAAAPSPLASAVGPVVSAVGGLLDNAVNVLTGSQGLDLHASVGVSLLGAPVGVSLGAAVGGSQGLGLALSLGTGQPVGATNGVEIGLKIGPAQPGTTTPSDGGGVNLSVGLGAPTSGQEGSISGNAVPPTPGGSVTGVSLVVGQSGQPLSTAVGVAGSVSSSGGSGGTSLVLTPVGAETPPANALPTGVTAGTANASGPLPIVSVTIPTKAMADAAAVAATPGVSAPTVPAVVNSTSNLSLPSGLQRSEQRTDSTPVPAVVGVEETARGASGEDSAERSPSYDSPGARLAADLIPFLTAVRIDATANDPADPAAPPAPAFAGADEEAADEGTEAGPALAEMAAPPAEAIGLSGEALALIERGGALLADLADRMEHNVPIWALPLGVLGGYQLYRRRRARTLGRPETELAPRYALPLRVALV